MAGRSLGSGGDVIAALYVQKGGVYFGLDGVDPWDEARDARLYAGPYPVVAHPPCARWCRLAKLVESRGGKAVGDDGGTFAAALASVRAWGGILEHPAWSLAWGVHGLTAPHAFGWALTTDGGWVCEVSQAAYGHRAPKATWLYYVGAAPPPPLNWARPPCAVITTSAPRGQKRVEYMHKAERSRTPIVFRDLLLSMAAASRA
jgi:hypothetical protein